MPRRDPLKKVVLGMAVAELSQNFTVEVPGVMPRLPIRVVTRDPWKWEFEITTTTGVVRTFEVRVKEVLRQ